MFDLEVAQPAGEIQNVSQVGSGVSVTASGFGQAELLRDGEKLQRTKWKDLAGLQQLLACNRHTENQREKINIDQMEQNGHKGQIFYFFLDFFGLSPNWRSFLLLFVNLSAGLFWSHSNSAY